MKHVLVASISLACAAVFLTGCGLQQTMSSNGVEPGLAIAGSIYGGQQPVTSSHLYLMAAGTTGYGKGSTSLLTTGDGTDSNGTYVLSDSNGSFSITGKYACAAGSEVYMLALGGKSNATSAANPAIALMASLGACPTAGNFVATAPYISINELTTVASAYALAGYMTGPTALSSSGTALATSGIANAFATSASLANIANGSANGTVGTNGKASIARINTLADIIAACINTDGTGYACTTLFANAKSSGTTPTETITALLNIAHTPAANVSNLYSLVVASAPFQPTLTSAPNDFALSIAYTTPNLANPLNMRVDATGNVWFRNGSSSNIIEELSPTGAVLSGAGGYAGGSGVSIALDAQGNAFLASRNSFGILKLSSSGALLSPATGYLGTCNDPNANLAATAMDGSGNVWGSGAGGCALKITNLGTVLSGTSGFPSTSDNSVSLALDSTNAAWIGGIANSTIRRVSAKGSVLADYGSVVHTPFGIAIDSLDGVWIANRGEDTVTHLLASGVATHLTGGGLAAPYETSIDGAGNVWVANNAPRISTFTNAEATVSPAAGYMAATSGIVRSITIDGSGNVWTALNGADAIVEFVGGGRSGGESCDAWSARRQDRNSVT